MNENMSQSGETDIQVLVKRIQQGDSDLFGRIFDIFADRIFRFAYLRIGDRAEAQDVTSEVFLGAFESIQRYKPRANAKFSTWLFSIARRVVANYYRQRGKKQGDIPLEEISGVLPDNSPFELHKADMQISYEAALNHISELPPEVRDVLTLKFIEEMDYPEIEQITGKKQNHIRVLVHRGLKQLREKLDSSR